MASIVDKSGFYFDFTTGPADLVASGGSLNAFMGSSSGDAVNIWASNVLFGGRRL